MSGALPPESVQQTIREAVDDGMPQAVAELSRLVRIPSVSWDGFDPAHVQASAEADAELNGGVAILLLRALRHDLDVFHMQDGDGNLPSILEEQPGHAQLLG